jgi:hypothetical protein
MTFELRLPKGLATALMSIPGVQGTNFFCRSHGRRAEETLIRITDPTPLAREAHNLISRSSSLVIRPAEAILRSSILTVSLHFVLNFVVRPRRPRCNSHLLLTAAQ